MEKPKLTLSGPIGSRNAGEQFIRVDEISNTDGPFIQRKTGFIPIVEGGYDDALKLIQEGKRVVKMGSQTRNGVYNVSLVNPEVALVEAPGAAANATTLEHSA